MPEDEDIAVEGLEIEGVEGCKTEVLEFESC
jgi:hypothetical protein